LKKPAAKEENRNVVFHRVAEGHKMEVTGRNRALKTVVGKTSNVVRNNKVADHRDKILRVEGHNRAGNKTVRSKGLRKTVADNSKDHRNKVEGHNRGPIKIRVMKQKINKELITTTSGFLT
jgi:hypothetical protein